MQNRFDPRDITSYRLDTIGFGSLSDSSLHPQIKLLAIKFSEQGIELFLCLLPDFVRFHHKTVLIVNLVFIGNLAAANLNASRAISSLTPWISYSMEPGLI